MPLSKFIKSIPGITPAKKGLPDPDITQITEDSRAVKPGDLFVAYKGVKGDGMDYAIQAIKSGAAAILTEEARGALPNLSAPVFVAKNPRADLGALCHSFYAPQPRWIAAVTGTDGKTSTVHFTRQLWHLLKQPSASFGTLGLIINEKAQAETRAVFTNTPTITHLHRTLADLKKQRIDRVAFEASSHGLHQERIAGVSLAAAGFTNLSRDHLDYHGTLEEYFAAKLRLFDTYLDPYGTAVVNADTLQFDAIRDVCRQRGIRVMGYGKAGKELALTALETSSRGITLGVTHNKQETTIHLPVLGHFQAMNLLCAMGMVMATGENFASLAEAASHIQTVPGRMEIAGITARGATIVVDYAHTPDALETVLKASRQHVHGGKLWVVFGCGGDRDRGKRPMMGKAAKTYADQVIVTDDNPRTEIPAQIRADVMAGAPGAREIGDRREAIRYAIDNAHTGDIVVLAGKGHESTQEIAGKTYPHHDPSVVKEMLETA